MKMMITTTQETTSARRSLACDYCCPGSRLRLRFRFVYVLTCTIQVAVACVVIWYLGQKNLVDTADSLSLALCNELVSHARDIVDEFLDAKYSLMGALTQAFRIQFYVITPPLQTVGMANATMNPFAQLSSLLATLPENQRHDIKSFGGALGNSMFMLVGADSNVGWRTTYTYKDAFTGGSTLSYFDTESVCSNVTSVCLEGAAFVPVRSTASVASLVSSGRWVYNPTGSIPYNTTTRPWYVAAKQARGQISAGNVFPSVGTASVSLYFAIAQAFYDPNLNASNFDLENIAGVAYMNVAVTSLSQPLSALNVGANGAVFLVHSNSTLILSSISSLYPGVSLLSQTQDVASVASIASAQMTQWNLFSGCNPYSTQIYSATVQSGGTAYSVYASQVRSYSCWYVVTVLNRSDFDGGLSTALRNFVLVTVAVCVFSGLVTLQLANIITRPLSRIVSYMNELRQLMKVPEVANSNSEAALEPTNPSPPSSPPDNKKSAQCKQLYRRWKNRMKKNRTTDATGVGGANALSVISIVSVNPPNPVASETDGKPQTLQPSCQIEITRPQRSASKSSTVRLSDTATRHGTCLAGSCLAEVEVLQASFSAMLRALCSSYEQSDRANDAKRHFIRYIFHEIRVPFNALKLGLQQIRMEETNIKSQFPYVADTLELMDDQASAITRILNDVLSLQKIEEGAFQLETTPFDLEHTIVQCVSSFHSAVIDKCMILTAELQSLPSCLSGHPVINAYSFGGRSPLQVVSSLSGPTQTTTRDGNAAELDALLLANRLSSMKVRASWSKSNLSPSSTESQSRPSLPPINERAVERTRHDDNLNIHRTALVKKDDEADKKQLSESAIQQSYKVMGDQYRIRQVLGNFISNAIKFTPAGGTVTVRLDFSLDPMEPSLPPPVTVDSSSERQAPEIVWCRVSVKDSGVGISSANQLKLFQPYTQFSAGALQKGAGTGLGLSIAKQLIELHGGTIRCVSELGNGSDFFFVLPLQLVVSEAKNALSVLSVSPPSLPTTKNMESEFRVRLPGEVAEKAEATVSLLQPLSIPTSPAVSAEMASNQKQFCSLVPPMAATPDVMLSPRSTELASKLRVLVVDDSPPTRKLMVMLLQRMGFQASGLENGRLAVDAFLDLSLSTPEQPVALSPLPFDIVCMDGHMPVLDGMDATRQLRALGVSIPIIALTGNALSEDQHAFLACGASALLTKPVDKEELLRTFQRFLN